MPNTDEISKEAVRLATQWQDRANALQTPQEKSRHAQICAGHQVGLRLVADAAIWE